uniref:EGF-like domain-containing protein n=1 Tax=Magallana gigas TaxID=29159 RepID=A0A8W8IEW7_MAGGI
MGRAVPAFLQVKVDPYNRTDTGKPNSSPVVLVKPYYSLENGKTHKIHIPAVDDDADVIECELSNFIEAGAFQKIVKNLTTMNIIRMNKKDCLLTINLNNSRFSVGDTFALPITVKDYGRKYIVTLSRHSAYETPLGRVTVLMYFKVTGRTDPPEFIPPTPPNNQAYTVYQMYILNRRIIKFNFLRRDGTRVQKTAIQSVPGDPTAVYISMGWSPVDSDIGKHIVCANAEDSNGISTVYLRCFRIDVKASIFRPHPPKSGKPYFASIPFPQDISCHIYSYCLFPVFAATDNTGGIVRVTSTDTSVENITIYYSPDVINGTIHTKIAKVEFLALTPGPRKICLNATDRFEWTVGCLIVAVERQGINLCQQRPCGVSNACIDVDMSPYFFCLQCPTGKTGTRCEFDIDVCHPTTCSEYNICQQNNGSYQCLSVNIQEQCPHTCSKSEARVCVRNHCVCALWSQHNESCKSNYTDKSNSSIIPYFAAPTLSVGSFITCDFYERTCEFPVYVFSESTPKVSFSSKMSIYKSLYRGITVLTSENNTNGIYQSTIVISKNEVNNPKYQEYDLCLNVARNTTPQDITDRQCFHVVDRGVPSRTNHMSQLYSNCSFAIPTIPRESVIGCKRGHSCHFYMYAATTNGNCSDLITSDRWTAVFSPVFFSGLCRYEIVHTNTSSVGTNTICFMICSHGESRCYQIYTNDILDQCEKDHCLNKGYCQTDASGNVRCHCQEGFWGARCEKGICESKFFCHNNALCVSNNGKPSCFCRGGFEGPTCAFEINRNLTDMVENGGQFTHLSLFESIPCYINTPCVMPISIIRNVHSAPTIVVGFSNETLDVQSLQLEPSVNTSGIVRGTVTVVGDQIGPQRICLDSIANPKTAKIEDEICFQINIVPGNVLETVQSDPYFVDPTPPNATVLQCVVNEPCYVNLWARSQAGVKQCPLLGVNKIFDNGVYVFPLRNTTNQPCVYESLMLIHNISDLNVCFSLSSDTSNIPYRYTQILRDTRCYAVRVLPKLTVKGPCSGQFCYNGGFCDGSSSIPRCMCRSGFSGNDCSKRTTELSVDYKLVRPYFLSFPQSEYVTCVQNQPCNFSVSASTTNCRSIIKIENAPNSEENVTIRYSNKTVGMTEAITGDVTLLSRRLGRRYICLRAIDCKTFTQKCLFITVVKANPCESSPCLHSGHCLVFNAKSGFTCSCSRDYTGKLCEIKIRPCTSRDTCHKGSTCDPVGSESFFRCVCPPGKTGVRCDVDAGYQEKCSNSSLCRNNAACHSKSQTLSCVCRLGFKGNNCSEKANDNLRNAMKTGARFADVAIPKSVICYVDFPCLIPFTLTKSIFNKPQVALGYYDPSLQITKLTLGNTISAEGTCITHGVTEVVKKSLGSARICLDTLDKSWQTWIEDEICFQVNFINGSYYKHLTDVPRFVQPTFETDSLFQCLVGSYCHLNLWAENDYRKQSCPGLKSESDKNLEIFVMPPLHQTMSPCTYDISLKADTHTNATMCFYLEGDEGVQLDKRCYTVEILNSIEKGSCACRMCLNGGFCDGHTSVKTCLCPLGFSGENCRTEHGIRHAVSQRAIHNPLLGNMLLPRQVICPLNEKCSVQLVLLTRKGFKIDIKVDPSSIEIKEKEEVRVSEDFLITLTLIHKHTGSHQMCINLSSEIPSFVTDRICCNIFTKDTDNQTKEETEQLFIPPSPTNASAFSCSPGLECHMMLYLKRGYYNQCPEVSVIPSVGASVHVFNNSDCDVCSVDVLIKLSLSHPGQRLQQCLQATDYDFGSTERRCYFLENVQHTFP